MIRRRQAAAAAGLLAMLIFANTAAATTQAFRTWQTSSNGWKGSRVTISNPSSGESSIAPPDFLLASAYADSGQISGIQGGVTYEWARPRPRHAI